MADISHFCTSAVGSHIEYNEQEMYIFTLENGSVLNFCCTLGMAAGRFRPFLIQICAGEVPTRRLKFKPISSFLQPGKCLLRALHSHALTNDSEFDVKIKNFYI